MKHQLNKTRIMKWALGLFGACAVAGLAFGVLSYVQLQQRINLVEHNAEMAQSLVEVARTSLLLRELNSGHVEDAKRFLNGELACALDAVKAIAPSTDAERQEFAATVADHIARDAKRHPEYNLASNQRTGH